jgi:hypothetical protein
LGSVSLPNQENNNNVKEWEIDKSKHSILLSVTFAGLGTGFIAFWLTLTFLYSGLLCAMGGLIVWALVRGMKGEDFATRSFVLFFISALIGIGVGYGSSFGSGVPISYF